MADDETEPLWLSSENDKLHKEAVADENLFGSGKIPLEGEVKEKVPFAAADEEEGFEPITTKKNYGSTTSNKEWPEDGSKSSKSKGSKGSSSKKKKKKTPPPPKSIFDNTDEEHEGEVDDDSTVTDDGKTTLTIGTKPHMPRRSWCVEYFRIFGAVTGIASLGLLATQMIPLFLAPLKSQGYFAIALKVYVTSFCILFLLVECNAPIPVFRNSQLLQNFISRGFLYSFLGLICLEEAYSERVKAMVSAHSDEFHVAWASLFMQISSWLIFACGIWYMLMGVCCLKRLRDKLTKKDKKVWARYRQDLKEWKRMNA